MNKPHKHKKNIVKSIGYRRYYLKDDRGVFCCLLHEVSPYTTEDIEKVGGFVAWRDTEWQYDEVEL